MSTAPGEGRVVLSDVQARALVMGRFVRVELGRRVQIAQGLFARSAFVGRISGKVRAYYNACQHQPVELDLPLEPPCKSHGDIPLPSVGEPGEVVPGARRAPMADDGVHLMCHSHGALYRPADGLCVLGPCYGASLVAIAVDEKDGLITLIPEAFSPEIA